MTSQALSVTQKDRESSIFFINTQAQTLNFNSLSIPYKSLSIKGQFEYKHINLKTFVEYTIIKDYLKNQVYFNSLPYKISELRALKKQILKLLSEYQVLTQAQALSGSELLNQAQAQAQAINRELRLLTQFQELLSFEGSGSELLKGYQNQYKKIKVLRAQAQALSGSIKALYERDFKQAELSVRESLKLIKKAKCYYQAELSAYNSGSQKLRFKFRLSQYDLIELNNNHITQSVREKYHLFLIALQKGSVSQSVIKLLSQSSVSNYQIKQAIEKELLKITLSNNLSNIEDIKK